MGQREMDRFNRGESPIEVCFSEDRLITVEVAATSFFTAG